MTDLFTLRRRSPTAIFLAMAAVLLAPLPAARGQSPRTSAKQPDLVATATEKFIGEASVFVFIANLIALAVILDAIDEVIHTVLDLPKQQRDEVEKIKDDTKKKFDAFQALPLAERRDQMFTTLPALENDYVAQMNKALSDGQRPLFQQLVLQLRGPTALTDPEMAKSLQLTDEQRQRLSDTVDDYNGRIRQLLGDGEKIGYFKVASILVLRKERDKDLLAVLTREQQEQWTEQKGQSHLDVEAVVTSLVKKQIDAKLKKPKADDEPESPKPAAPAKPKSK